MGHLFTRMSTVWLEQQTLKSLTQNRLMNKRKHTDYEYISNKKKNIIIKHDSDDDDECLILPPRVSSINRLSLSIGFFQCQLCQQYFKTKDIYLDHLMMCSRQNQVSIKIVRAIKDKNERMN